MIYLKNIAKNLFKKIFQLIFKLIYGNIIYEQDNLFSKKIEINEIKNEKIINYFGKIYKIYKITDGKVYTDNVENVAIINQNKILDNISYQQIKGDLVSAKNNVCIAKGTPRIKKKFKGRILCLAQGASGHSNYSHWLFDILPKIKLYSEFYDLKDLNYFYLNKLKKFQVQSLEILGLDKIKVIDSNKYRHVQSDELICTDHPSYYQGYILEQAKNLPHWIVEWLRDKYLSNAKNISCSDKIFIDRSSAISRHCQFANEEEIAEYLSKKGFIKYKLENMDLDKQIFLFKNAKFVFGAHGAGLSNLTFCQKGTKVLEIRPEDHPNTIYNRLSNINNLNYNLISTKKIDSETTNGDIYLNIKELEKYI